VAYLPALFILKNKEWNTRIVSTEKGEYAEAGTVQLKLFYCCGIFSVGVL
jgi:hypothetical protein